MAMSDLDPNAVVVNITIKMIIIITKHFFMFS